MGGGGVALTSFIFEGSYNFSTVWALVIILLILVDTASTEYFPAAPVPMLLRVPGHTQANQTLEVIRGLLHKLVVIASRSRLSHFAEAEGCFEILVTTAPINHMMLGVARNYAFILMIQNSSGVSDIIIAIIL